MLGTLEPRLAGTLAALLSTLYAAQVARDAAFAGVSDAELLARLGSESVEAAALVAHVDALFGAL